MGITKPGQTPKKHPPTLNNAQGQPLFLDSGSTNSILPRTLVDDIVANFLGATYDSARDLHQVDYSYASQDETIDFGFGAKEIRVLFKQFIWSQ